MAAKKPVLSVKRFTTWSPTHQADFLKKQAGTSAASFAAMSPAQKRAALAKGRANLARDRAAAKDPATLLKPLTPEAVADQSGVAANYKYGEAQREIDREKRSSGLQSEKIAGLFKAYKDELANLDLHQKAGNKSAQDFVTKLGTDTLAQSQSQVTKDAANQQADAATRGASTDPSIAAKAEQAAQSRKNSLDLVNAVLGGQAKNADNFMSSRQAVTTNQAIQTEGKESGYRKTLHEKLKGLLTEKGEYRQTVADKLRQDAVERDVADRAFGLNVSEATAKAQAEQDKIKADAAADKAKTKADTSKESKTLNKWGYTNAEWRAKTPEQREKIIAQQKSYGKKDAKVKSPYTDSATFKARDAFQSSRGSASKLKQAGFSRGEVLNLLVTGKKQSKTFPIGVTKVSGDIARAIVEQLYDGRISATTVKQLHKRGVRIKDLPVKTTKPYKAPAYKPPTVSPGDTKSDLPG